MSFFRRLMFNLWYFRRPPWDSGITPPELLAVLKDHPTGRAIDLGCGTGTNLITLARLGWQVTGVDFASRAIDQARKKANQTGVSVDLCVGDVTHLDANHVPYDFALDLGCFHSLSEREKGDYLHQMDRILVPAGSGSCTLSCARPGIFLPRVFLPLTWSGFLPISFSFHEATVLSGASGLRLISYFKNIKSSLSMHILFIFLDGVGLGTADPVINPFARAEMPNLQKLLGGQKLLASTAPYEGERASLLALDASLGVAGLPQSATGQAVLLTGRNIPAEIGYHYGPKPDKATAAHLQDGGIFGKLTRAGKRAALLNAYPPGYFHGIDSGRRLYSSIPLSVIRAGLSLLTTDDLVAGRAISADFTAEGLRERMNMPELPILTLSEAGARLATLSKSYDFAFFEYWLTDYAGHGQDMDDALRLLSHFDAVFGSLVNSWNDDEGLILLTSDHGNLEDLSTRRHTANPVPLLLIGNSNARKVFTEARDLIAIVPAIRKILL